VYRLVKLCFLYVFIFIHLILLIFSDEITHVHVVVLQEWLFNIVQLLESGKPPSKMYVHL